VAKRVDDYMKDKELMATAEGHDKLVKLKAIRDRLICHQADLCAENSDGETVLEVLVRSMRKVSIRNR
jgi:hypothetical protein